MLEEHALSTHQLNHAEQMAMSGQCERARKEWTHVFSTQQLDHAEKRAMSGQCERACALKQMSSGVEWCRVVSSGVG